MTPAVASINSQLGACAALSMLVGIMLLAATSTGIANEADPLTSFDTPEQSALYHSLLEEYRCLKCQNQNLADSNAGLAGDLRREIRDQILSGKTKSDIDEYLVARYGEFVLYRPRFSAKTAVLWIGPFVLLLIALSAVVVMIRKRAATSSERPGVAVSGSPANPSELDKERLNKARKLLES